MVGGKQIMKIFADKELKKEIKSINFGIVKAGETKTITVWIYNDEKNAVLTNLAFEFFGPSLPPTEKIEIVKAPLTISPLKAEPLVLKWKPSRTFKEALDIGLRVTGEAIYLASRAVEVEEEVKE